MKVKQTKIYAWFLFGLVTVSVAVGIGLSMYNMAPVANLASFWWNIFSLVPVAFAFVGALILSRQPNNSIGWLMMLPGLSFSILVDGYMAQFSNPLVAAPASPTPLLMLILWFSNWNWVLLIFPILFLLVLFPTGRPLSPRWRWLIYFGLAMMATMPLLATFGQEFAPGSLEVDWGIPNPIGFISEEWVNTYFLGPWFVALPALTLLCAVSMFVRFRRARAVERQQIKWLFYAGAVFAVCYIPSFFGQTYSQAESIFNLLFAIGMLAIPSAIAISILRYRLYDIDIIIRRTLQYALLTGLLALVYFGSVLLLQSVVESISGQQSPIVIVLSTLAIAALFNPLRARVQDFIDRRFYRKKYDAEQALAQFAATARDEVDMDQLNAALLKVVEETMQPESINLWLYQRK